MTESDRDTVTRWWGSIFNPNQTNRIFLRQRAICHHQRQHCTTLKRHNIDKNHTAHFERQLKLKAAKCLRDLGRFSQQTDGRCAGVWVNGIFDHYYCCWPIAISGHFISFFVPYLWICPVPWVFNIVIVQCLCNFLIITFESCGTKLVNTHVERTNAHHSH